MLGTKSPPQEYTLRVCAYHEAGHAVACFIFGHPPRLAQIGGPKRTLSAVSYVDYTNCDHTSPGHDPVVKYLEAYPIVVMAGPAAEQLECMHVLEWQDTRCVGDVSKLRQYISNQPGSTLSNGELLRRTELLATASYDRATSLLACSPANLTVAALADALLIEWALSRQQMVDIITDAAPELEFTKVYVGRLPDIIGAITVDHIRGWP